MALITKEFDSTFKFIEFLMSRGEEYIYRGQMQDWELETSLQRADLNYLWPRGDVYENFLKEILKSKFQYQELINYDTPNPFDIISLLQHYRVPTNFLDFTRSPAIALFFALQQAILSYNDIKKILNNDGRFYIYAIDTTVLRSANIEKLTNNFKKVLDGSSKNLEKIKKYFPYETNEIKTWGGDILVNKLELLFNNKYLDGCVYNNPPNIENIIFPVPDYKHNKRSLFQQSIFLTQSSYQGKMYEYLRSYPHLGYKMSLPYCEADEIIKYLQKMNLNPLTISPDFDGFLSNEWNKFLFTTYFESQKHFNNEDTDSNL